MNDDLLLSLNNAFHGHGWHGPTLLGSIRGVSPREALIVPSRLKHCIWHLVLHAAYWKYAACLRVRNAGISVRGLNKDESGTVYFPRSPSNFPDPPAKGSAREWREDVEMLKEHHAALVKAVSRIPDKVLDSIPARGRSTKLRDVVVGVAAHDAYHTGQVQLIKRLIRRKSRPDRGL